MTAVPGVRWYASKVGRKKDQPDMAEHEQAGEMPTRLAWKGE